LSEAPSIPSGGKTVALTFDDGPGASTAAILSILEAFGVRATFFNIGEQETWYPQDVVAEEEAGFLIGNHTWNHPDMTKLSAAAQAAELDEVIQEQQSLVGSSPCVFRPPYGDYDSTTLALARQRHMAVWLWDVDTEDWMAEGSSSAYWVNRIISLAESEGGALSHPVVLMHNQAIPMPATVAALPTIIRYFQDHGYTFVDLLGHTGPPSSCGTSAENRPRAAGTVVGPGHQLLPGTTVASPGGQFHFVMQRDGNLVVYTSDGRVLWESQTNGNPGASAVMQRDGNFVLYSASGRALWESRTDNHPGAWLAVQTDGNVVVYDSAGPLWATSSLDSELLGGEQLQPGWYLQSPGRLCELVMQNDGNLVSLSANGRVLWETGTNGNPGALAVMQRDGNFVIYSTGGRALWESGTQGHAGDRLTVTDWAQVLVASPTGALLWERD
jgi:peptidoglycan/xylan/chitin deacetylase (PgdA/CDA1 family)